MAVLLLKFDAPMQSWGITEKLKDHPTDFIPSKSGVVGMIASAEGRRRDEDVSDLVALRFGVRIDQPGKICADFHMSVANGSFGRWKDAYKNGHLSRNIPSKDVVVGHREYLEDAVFTCGLEGDKICLERILESLRYPANALFLGRRSCPVTINLVQGIVEGTLEEALADGSGHLGFLDIRPDETADSVRVVRDFPVSFHFEKRVYEFRSYKEVRL